MRWAQRHPIWQRFFILEALLLWESILQMLLWELGMANAK